MTTTREYDQALDLSGRDGRQAVKRCKFCDARIVWVKSRKSGKSYPVQVVTAAHGPDYMGEQQFRFAPWMPHTCDREATR
jgi:hypothetical protein